MDNKYAIGMMVTIFAYISFIHPEVKNYIDAFFVNKFSPEEASKYQLFIELLVLFGVAYFIQNWFLGKYR